MGNGLTKTMYLKHKERKLTDKAIMSLYELTYLELAEIKSGWGLKGYKIPAQAVANVERKKRQFVDLYNLGWSHEHIAEAMGIANSSLSEFKEANFPHLKRKKHVAFTNEQIKIMEIKKLTRPCVRSRMLRGMTFEEATAATKRKPKHKFTKKQMEKLNKLDLLPNTIRWRMMRRGMSFDEAISIPLQSGKRFENENK